MVGVFEYTTDEMGNSEGKIWEWKWEELLFLRTKAYHEEIREEKYSVLDNELFIQKPISNDDLMREINNRIGLT